MRLAIITVNWNAPHFLRVQLPAINKHLPGSTVYVIETAEQRQCKHICREFGAHYRHYLSGDADYSRNHAHALNLAYNSIYKDYDVIGILDHDCFPIGSVMEEINWVHTYIGVRFFGTSQMRGDKTYPNPCCLFLKTSLGKLDFLPCEGLDTAGQLHSVYKGVCTMLYEFDNTYGIEIFAKSFAHIIKGSNWIGTAENGERVKKAFEYIKTLV